MSRLGESRHPNTSSKGCVIAIHCSGLSLSITWRCHSPSVSDIRTHSLVLAPSISPLFTHLLPCAQHCCFTPVTEASAMSSQGPVRSLWLWQMSPGTCSKRVNWITPHTSLSDCRTKSQRLFQQPSTAGQPSGLPCFLLWAIKGSTWLPFGDFLLVEPSNQCL